LQHRTSNLLAVISAVADKTLRDDRTVKEVRELLRGRITALARTHQKLTKTDWTGVNLRDIIRQELDPFADQTEITGPDVELNSQSAQNFSLAVHELTTNAIKYGALSAPGGRIGIHWTTIGSGSDGHLKFQWLESAGPPVAPPARQGFGTLLLRTIFANAEIEYPPEGFRCTLALRLSDLASVRRNP
jgi:two-component sensor histidine kinase